MTQITSHVLDTSVGKPAEGILITLHQQSGDNWQVLGSEKTNADGRVGSFLDDAASATPLPSGIYKLTFSLSDYYKKSNTKTFYPHVDVVFEIGGDGQHYHVPLLLNPFGYSTYRGS